MGKRLVIKGADFSANAIEQIEPQAQIEWNIGNISSTGELRVVDTAIYSNLQTIKEASVSLLCTMIDSSVFQTQGVAPVLALYTENDVFITRIVGSYNAAASAVISSYPTAKKVRLAVGNFKNSVTSVETALTTFSYITSGI